MLSDVSNKRKKKETETKKELTEDQKRKEKQIQEKEEQDEKVNDLFIQAIFNESFEIAELIWRVLEVTS